jgi:microcystin-dependent protein
LSIWYFSITQLKYIFSNLKIKKMEGTIGYIKMFAGNFAPRNWSYCQGQTIAIASNTALFSILGTTYGGNGTTTFQLPDLQGRVPIGQGTGPGLSNIALGQKAGTNSVTLSTNNLPQHIHGLSAAQIRVNNVAEAASPVGRVLGNSPSNYAEGFGSNQFLAAGSLAGTTDSAGSGVALNITNPYLGMNYVICQFGIFPARN